MVPIICRLGVLVLLAGLAAAQIPSAEEIRVISEQIWQADGNRASDADVQYNSTGCSWFTYVNEDIFKGPTYAAFIALMDNYNPVLGQAETCGAECRDEENAFLDSILNTRPIQLLHNWLFGNGLAPASQAEFKLQLCENFFMQYARSGAAAPLESSGFEHVFLGELRANRADATGFHNWITAYFREKSGDLMFGPYLDTCPNQVEKYRSHIYGGYKPISSMFMRTSPEVEIALYALCISVHSGTNCPVRRDGVNLSMTSWDIVGLPKTVASAYPNC